MQNIYLPKDTFDLNLNVNQIDNFALRLNRFPKTAFVNRKSKFVTYHKTREKRREIIHSVNCNFNDSEKKILEFSAKYIFSLEKLPSIKLETSYFIPDWKMIIGLGTPSVYETSITLHHIYGFPYIPGQALKGVVKNYVINEYFEKDEKRAEGNDCFTDIFGNQEKQGKVIFFDVYPTSKPEIVFDIMNVHYSEYYSKKNREPTDDQKPNPITFLTVKNTGFAFSVGINKDYNELDFSAFKEKSLSELMKSALEEKGVGAKTTTGYGYLNNKENKGRLFRLCYDSLLKKEQEVIEDSKPFFQKLIDNQSIELSFEFLRNVENPDSEKNAVSDMMKRYFSDAELWKKKKLNNQQHEFANLAYDFLELITSKDEEIINFIKLYGGNKLKTKFITPKNVIATLIKPPSKIGEVEKIVAQIEANNLILSKEEFEIIFKKINTLFYKDKKNRGMKSNKKKGIKARLGTIKARYNL